MCSYQQTVGRLYALTSPKIVTWIIFEMSVILLVYQVKEKEALDSVLKSGQTKGGSEKKDEGGALEGGAGSEELGKLREALKVITEEKSRLETSFTEDKKKSLSKIKALEGAKCNLEADRATIKAELEEMKAKWMVERHQRDKEADDYALQVWPLT